MTEYCFVDKIEVSAMKGVTIDGFINEIVDLAYNYSTIVIGEFNQKELIATPHSKVNELMDYYWGKNDNNL